jgi:ABC-type transport system involved in multi-copper enzyme maturation permease subunit
VTAFLADVRHTLLAPATVATLLIAFVLATLLSTTGPAPVLHSPVMFAVSYEYRAGFVFQFYTFNATGQPVAGVRTAVAIGQGNSSVAPPVTGVATTSPDGFSTVTVPVNDSNGSLDIVITSATSTTEAGGSISAATPGTMVPGWGTLTPIGGGHYGLVPRMLLFYPGADGGSPTDATLTIQANYSGANPRTVNLASVPVSNAVSSYALPTGSIPTQASRVDFVLSGPGGRAILTQSESPSSLEETGYSDTAWGMLLNDRAHFWGFLAAIVGVGVGYGAYARDRSTRSLEPLVAFPTTKLRILARRYVSGLVPLAAATSIGVGVEFVLSGPLPGGLAPELVLAIWGALVAVGAAFLGLTFLMAHLVRSSGLVVGVGIGVATLLAFFLTTVIYLAILLTRGPSWSYPAADQVQIGNPTMLPVATIREYFAGIGSPGLPPPMQPAAGAALAVVLGVTIAILVLTPLLAALLASRRD